MALDIKHARQVLDTDHYDIKDVKERILEYLAVRKLRLERQRLIMSRLKAGAKRDPGRWFYPLICGTTARWANTAWAQHRPRAWAVSLPAGLGGVRDEAEVRATAALTSGALPGRVIQSLKRVGTRNPVFM